MASFLDTHKKQRVVLEFLFLWKENVMQTFKGVYGKAVLDVRRWASSVNGYSRENEESDLSDRYRSDRTAAAVNENESDITTDRRKPSGEP